MTTGNGDVLRVPDSQLNFDENLVFFYRGKPFTGVAYEIRDGELSEINYQDGYQHGVSKDWWRSGVLKSDSMYRENTLHGASHEYFESGELRSHKIYEYGILVFVEDHDVHGQMIRSFDMVREDPGFKLLENLRKLKGWEREG